MLNKKVIIALLISLLIVFSGTSYWYEETHKPVLKVNVGYANATYVINIPIPDNVTHIENITNATTIINDGSGIIDLEVIFWYYFSSSTDLLIALIISSNVVLNSGLFAQNFLFTAKELDNFTNGYLFDPTWIIAHNATIWDPNTLDQFGALTPNIAYIGFTPNSTKFYAQDLLNWEIRNFNIPNTFTLRIESKCKIGNNMVPAIVDVIIKFKEL